MPKYNLALTPISQNERIINCATQLSELAYTYLLGKNSFPHITLYKFEVEESEVAKVWQLIMKNWHKKPIDLAFNEFSCLMFNGMRWVSLLPNKVDELHGMHELIAKLLDKPIKDNFDPHLTLLNTTNKDYESVVDMIKPHYQAISDTFVLSLGHSDKVGQLTSIIQKITYP